MHLHLRYIHVEQVKYYIQGLNDYISIKVVLCFYFIDFNLHSCLFVIVNNSYM